MRVGPLGWDLSPYDETHQRAYALALKAMCRHSGKGLSAIQEGSSPATKSAAPRSWAANPPNCGKIHFSAGAGAQSMTFCSGSPTWLRQPPSIYPACQAYSLWRHLYFPVPLQRTCSNLLTGIPSVCVRKCQVFSWVSPSNPFKTSVSLLPDTPAFVIFFPCFIFLRVCKLSNVPDTLVI